MSTPEIVAVKDWLKENLTIEITNDSDYSDWQNRTVCIKIKLDGELIASDYLYLRNQ